MVDTGDTAVAEVGAEVHTDIEAMKSGTMGAVVIAEGTMTETEIGTITMKVGPRNTRARAPCIGETVAGARKVEDTLARLEKVVKKDVPKLRNGTGKGNKQKSMRSMLVTILQRIMMDTTISNMSSELLVFLFSG